MIHVTCYGSPRTQRFTFETNWLGHTIEKPFVPDVRFPIALGGWVAINPTFQIYTEIWQVDWFSRDLLEATAKYAGVRRVGALMSAKEKALDPGRFPA